MKHKNINIFKKSRNTDLNYTLHKETDTPTRNNVMTDTSESPVNQ